MNNRFRMGVWIAALGLLTATLAFSDASAQGRKGGGGKMGGMGGEAMGEDSAEPMERSPLGRYGSREDQERTGLIPTGLKPIYPSGATCPEVASPFASQTRYDGSARRGDANHGRHNGIDISCAEGTPLLAIADGTVILKFVGGQMVGNRIMFQHGPADTGLGVWLYTNYQHLTALPDLEIGATVKLGQAIGRCGRTGTTGGHYGASGYPHLHLGMWVGDTDRYIDRRMAAFPVEGRHVDPLAVFAGKGLDSHRLAALPESEKTFPVPYATPGGERSAPGARFVWPFACPAR